MNKGPKDRTLASIAATEHARILDRYVARRVSNKDDAADVKQSAYAKLLRSLNRDFKRLDRKITLQNVRQALLRFARDEMAELFEQQAMDNEHLERTGDVECYSAGDLQEAYRSLLRDQIVEAISEMSATRAACLVLHLVGWSNPEIAEKLDRKETAVRQHVCRGRNSLVNLFDEENS